MAGEQNDNIREQVNPVESVRDMQKQISSRPQDFSKELQSPNMSSMRNNMIASVRQDLQAQGVINKDPRTGVYTTDKVDNSYNPTGGIRKDPRIGIYSNGTND